MICIKITDGTLVPSSKWREREEERRARGKLREKEIFTQHFMHKLSALSFWSFSQQQHTKVNWNCFFLLATHAYCTCASIHVFVYVYIAHCSTQTFVEHKHLSQSATTTTVTELNVNTMTTVFQPPLLKLLLLLLLHLLLLLLVSSTIIKGERPLLASATHETCTRTELLRRSSCRYV